MWVKYHFKTDQGIRNLPAAEADVMQATNPDHAIQDLYNAIADGNPPSWTVYVQVGACYVDLRVCREAPEDRHGEKG